ncbi:hypothetical protein D3C72_2495870 [compost metagenome]
MHTQRAALFIIGDGLDHAAEDIWVDLFPVQVAGVQQISARDAGEAWHFCAAGE